MVSQAKGILTIPVWVDDGVVEPLVNNDGEIPVNLASQAADLDVNIASQDADIEVVQQNPSDLGVSNYAYYGADWVKVGLPFTLYQRLALTDNFTATAGGVVLRVIGTVPAGQIWTIQATMSMNSTTAGIHQHQLYAGGLAYTILQNMAVGAGVLVVNAPVAYVLTPGDAFVTVYYGVVIGDVLLSKTWGFITSFTL